MQHDIVCLLCPSHLMGLLSVGTTLIGMAVGWAMAKLGRKK